MYILLEIYVKNIGMCYDFYICYLQAGISNNHGKLYRLSLSFLHFKFT